MLTRDELIAQVSEAIWDGLEEQVDMGCVDREDRIIDTGMADSLDMDEIAATVIDVVVITIQARLKQAMG